MFIYMIQTRFLRIKQSSASGMKKNLVVIPKKWKKKQVIELESPFFSKETRERGTQVNCISNGYIYKILWTHRYIVCITLAQYIKVILQYLNLSWSYSQREREMPVSWSNIRDYKTTFTIVELFLLYSSKHSFILVTL